MESTAVVYVCVEKKGFNTIGRPSQTDHYRAHNEENVQVWYTCDSSPDAYVVVAPIAWAY